MKVYFVGAGPGDKDLITIKGFNLLRRTEYCIYAGSLVNKELLSALPPNAKKYDSSKMNLENIVDVFKEAKTMNKDLVRLHSGDPAIYGAIQEQMHALNELEIPYEIVPGVSSFVAAAAALNQELTLPGVTQTIVITRMEGNTPMPEKEHLSKLAPSTPTLCIFLSIEKISEIVKILLPHYGKDCPIAVVYKASWPEQKIIRSRLSNIEKTVQDEAITKTAMIIVGHVLDKEFERSILYSENTCKKQ
ncbi:MAG: precorrin-4 C(11)-methyltransferase [Planctomycetes bacterium]|nr:precorrin-4 C(11)-methyltransferase [Planctomycetota bacterium]